MSSSKATGGGTTPTRPDHPGGSACHCLYPDGTVTTAPRGDTADTNGVTHAVASDSVPEPRQRIRNLGESQATLRRETISNAARPEN